MKIIDSTFIQLIKRKDLLLFLTIIIAGLSLFGWITGNMGLASYSIKYIPIAPSNAVILIILTVIFLVNFNFEGPRVSKTIVIPLLLLVTLLCLIIFLNYFFKFSGDIENVIVKNPKKIGNILLGRMSPISSLLFIFICICIFGVRHNNYVLIKYMGGSLSLLVFIISSVLLIGYLYEAPLL